MINLRFLNIKYTAIFGQNIQVNKPNIQERINGTFSRRQECMESHISKYTKHCVLIMFSYLIISIKNKKVASKKSHENK